MPLIGCGHLLNLSYFTQLELDKAVVVQEENLAGGLVDLKGRAGQ
jgi:hypothetical protein